MDESGKKVLSFAQTEAMKHPGWDKAMEAIEVRFQHSPELRKWAVDATSARLMGLEKREEDALRAMGELAASDLKEIWKQFQIERRDKPKEYNVLSENNGK